MPGYGFVIKRGCLFSFHREEIYDTNCSFQLVFLFLEANRWTLSTVGSERCHVMQKEPWLHINLLYELCEALIYMKKWLINVLAFFLVNHWVDTFFKKALSVYHFNVKFLYIWSDVKLYISVPHIIFMQWDAAIWSSGFVKEISPAVWWESDSYKTDISSFKFTLICFRKCWLSSQNISVYQQNRLEPTQ